MKIAFCGKAKSGKTHAANYLQRKHGGYVLSFANALKEKAYALGWDGAKDERGRKFLQELGVCVRNYDENYWARQLRREIEEIQLTDKMANIFIDDCRFSNEVKMLKDMGFSLWYLQTAFLPEADAKWRDHESERLNPNWCPHWVHSEWGDLDEFERSLETTYEEYLKAKQRK